MTQEKGFDGKVLLVDQRIKEVLERVSVFLHIHGITQSVPRTFYCNQLFVLRVASIVVVNAHLVGYEFIIISVNKYHG